MNQDFLRQAIAGALMGILVGIIMFALANWIY